MFAVATAVFTTGAAEWDSYKQVIRLKPKAVEGLVNADFEDSSKYGPWKGRTAEIGRFGYNGNGGVRVWPRDKKLCFDFPFEGKLEPGREYYFCGSFRKNGRVHVSYNWQSYGPGNKHMNSAWNGAYAELDNGWQTCSFNFIPQKGAVRHQFFIYCFCKGSDEADKRTNDVHYIDCDNLILTESAPTWDFCNTWPIHNTIYNEEGRVRCHNAFIGRFFEPDAQPFYVMRLLTPDGKKLAEKLCHDKDGVITCAFGRLDYAGPAKLEAALYDRKNRLAYGTRTVDVSITPKFKPAKGRAFITEDGRTLVDGKPFMPLGFWTNFADFKRNPKETLPGNLKKLSDAGFNTIVEYNGYLLRNLDDRRYFYDQCEKYGIRVFAGECAIANWNDKDPDMPAKYEKRVRQYLDYPAIFAWFVTDEVNVNRVPELVKMRKILNRLSPGIPMWPCNIFEPEPFLPGEDVIGGDFYPYRGSESKLLGQDVRLARIEACQAAAAWIAPQCYNWNNGPLGYKKGKWIVSVENYLKGEPSENNMLANALHMASRGITGFMFYSYFDMLKSPDPTLPAKRWERMKSIAKTFKSLEPFITSGIKRVELPHRDVKGKSRVVALSDGKGNRRILIIGLDSDNVCEIDRAQLEGTSHKSRCGLTEIGPEKAVFTGGGISGDVIE